MSFEEDDSVVLHDEHSEYDGDVGTVTQVVETMFGDANYTVSFDDGQETGVPEENLEETDEEPADESAEDEAAQEEADEEPADESAEDEAAQEEADEA